MCIWTWQRSRRIVKQILPEPSKPLGKELEELRVRGLWASISSVFHQRAQGLSWPLVSRRPMGPLPLSPPSPQRGPGHDPGSPRCRLSRPCRHREDFPWTVMEPRCGEVAETTYLSPAKSPSETLSSHQCSLTSSGLEALQTPHGHYPSRPHPRVSCGGGRWSPFHLQVSGSRASGIDGHLQAQGCGTLASPTSTSPAPFCPGLLSINSGGVLFPDPPHL